MIRRTMLAGFLRRSAVAFSCVPQDVLWLAFAEWAANEHAPSPSVADPASQLSPGLTCTKEMAETRVKYVRDV